MFLLRVKNDFSVSNYLMYITTKQNQRNMFVEMFAPTPKKKKKKKKKKKNTKRYKQAKIRKRRNQKKIPTPKTEVGKTQLTIRYLYHEIRIMKGRCYTINDIHLLVSDIYILQP